MINQVYWKEFGSQKRNVLLKKYSYDTIHGMNKADITTLDNHLLIGSNVTKHKQYLSATKQRNAQIFQLKIRPLLDFLDKNPQLDSQNGIVKWVVWWSFSYVLVAIAQSIQEFKLVDDMIQYSENSLDLQYIRPYLSYSLPNDIDILLLDSFWNWMNYSGDDIWKLWTIDTFDISKNDWMKYILCSFENEKKVISIHPIDALMSSLLFILDRWVDVAKLKLKISRIETLFRILLIRYSLTYLSKYFIWYINTEYSNNERITNFFRNDTAINFLWFDKDDTSQLYNFLKIIQKEINNELIEQKAPYQYRASLILQA